MYANKRQHDNIRGTKRSASLQDAEARAAYTQSQVDTRNSDASRNIGDYAGADWLRKDAARGLDDANRYNRLSEMHDDAYESKISNLSVSRQFKTSVARGKNKVTSLIKKLSNKVTKK